MRSTFMESRLLSMITRIPLTSVKRSVISLNASTSEPPNVVSTDTSLASWAAAPEAAIMSEKPAALATLVQNLRMVPSLIWIKQA